MGTERFDCCNDATAMAPAANITSGASATNSAAYLRSRSGSPKPHRYSIRTFRPSDQPRSCRAKECDELAPFQLIESHSIPANQGRMQDIESARSSQRGIHASSHLDGDCAIASTVMNFRGQVVDGHPARSYAWSINRTTRAQSCTLIGGAAPRRQWSSASRNAVKAGAVTLVPGRVSSLSPESGQNRNE
jgi:hypothetical protein